MMRVLTVISTLLLVGAASAQTALTDGDGVRVNLPDVPDGSLIYARAFSFDTPADATSFRLELEDLGSARNVDIYLRGGENLPPIEEITGTDSQGNAFFDRSALIAQTDFFAQGVDSNELVIGQNSVNRLIAGNRWFVALIVFGGSGGSVGITYTSSTAGPAASQMTVDFDNPANDPDCDTTPWFDATAFTPIGNNNATTLGEARRNAIERAVTLTEAELRSPIPIKVAACWEAMGGDANGATLALARPNSFGLGRLLPGEAVDDVLYAQAIAARRGGTQMCMIDTSVGCEDPDLIIRFNSDLDGPVALGNAGFYYGFTPRAGAAGDADFVSTAIHELVHGLGFVSLVTENGELPPVTDGVARSSFTDRLIDNRSGTRTPFANLSDAQRVAAATSETGLQWIGAASSTSSRNLFRTVSDGLVRMHAPTEFAQGSSLSHVSSGFCELMRAINTSCAAAPFRSLGITRDMLHEIGWSPGPRMSPYEGLMFDRSRNGHGFDLRFAGLLSGNDPVYVMTYYSYENGSGAPEWFQAVGTIRNGVFASMQAIRQPIGEGFVRFNYDAAGATATGPVVGNVVVSFNDPAAAAACNDGVDRSNAAFVLPMQWTIDGDADEWCVEPVVPPGGFPNQDFGGLYYAGLDDLGWGFTIENIAGAGSTSLFVLAYVFAGDNTPVWYFGFVDGFVPGQPITMDLIQRDGYGRLGLFTDNLTDRVAGSLTLNLTSASTDINAGNTASINVDYLGSEGGNWSRNNVPIALLLPPRQ